MFKLIILNDITETPEAKVSTKDQQNRNEV